MKETQILPVIDERWPKNRGVLSMAPHFIQDREQRTRMQVQGSNFF